MDGPVDFINTLAFHSEGQCVAIGGDDCVVRLLPTNDASSAPLRWFEGEDIKESGRTNFPATLKGQVLVLKFSPDGDCLAVGGVSRSILIFSREDGARVETPIPAEPYVMGLDWTPDSQFIVSGGRDSTITLRSVAGQGATIFQISLGETNPVHALACNTDGTQVLVGTHNNEGLTIELPFNIRNAAIAKRIPCGGAVKSVAFSPNGEDFVVGSGGEKGKEIWRVSVVSSATNEVKWMKELERPIYSCTFSPTGKYIAIGYGSSMEVVHASSGTVAFQRIFLWKVHAVGFSPPTPGWREGLGLMTVGGIDKGTDLALYSDSFHGSNFVSNWRFPALGKMSFLEDWHQGLGVNSAPVESPEALEATLAFNQMLPSTTESSEVAGGILHNVTLLSRAITNNCPSESFELIRKSPMSACAITDDLLLMLIEHKDQATLALLLTHASAPTAPGKILNSVCEELLLSNPSCFIVASSREAVTACLPACIEAGFSSLVVSYARDLEHETVLAGPISALNDDGEQLLTSLVRSTPRLEGHPWCRNIVEFGTDAEVFRMPLPAVGTILPALQKLTAKAYPDLWACTAVSVVIQSIWSEYIRAVHINRCIVFSLEVVIFATFVGILASGDSTDDDGIDYNLAPSQLFLAYILDIALVAFSAWFIRLEVMQLKGNARSNGVQISFFHLSSFLYSNADFWNVMDWTSQLMVICSAIGHLCDWQPEFVYTIAGLGALALLVKAVSCLRGLDSFAHLVVVLEQNVLDMTAFLGLCVAIVIFCSLSFIIIFHTAPASDASDAGFDLGGSFATPFITTFNMGFFGDFDMSSFDTIASPLVGKFIFLVFMLLVSVVALNALIAILGDSAARVQETQVSTRNYELASLISEYKDTLSAEQNVRLEAVTVWQHVLSPVSVDDAGSDQTEWTGHIGAVKKMTAHQTATLQRDIAQLRRQISPQSPSPADAEAPARV